jgi:hypothetical protein
MTGQIDGEHLKIPAEIGHLLLPILFVDKSSMDKNQGYLP